MVLLFHHADLEHSQLDRGRRSAGLQGAHGLTVAQVGQVLPVDAQQHITWERKREDAVVFWCDVWVVAQSVQRERSPLLIRPSLDKQPCGWTLVTKIGSSPLLLPRPPATVMPRDSCGSFFTVMCFSLQVTHWDRSWEQSKHRLDFNAAKKKKKKVYSFHSITFKPRFRLWRHKIKFYNEVKVKQKGQVMSSLCGCWCATGVWPQDSG